MQLAGGVDPKRGLDVYEIGNRNVSNRRATQSRLQADYHRAVAAAESNNRINVCVSPKKELAARRRRPVRKKVER